MVLNTPLSHKRIICYYNTHVYRDPTDHRSSCPEVFCRKSFLEISQILQENTCARVSFFNKVASLKRDSGTVFLPENFVKFLTTLFFKERFWWLLL